MGHYYLWLSGGYFDDVAAIKLRKAGETALDVEVMICQHRLAHVLQLM